MGKDSSSPLFFVENLTVITWLFYIFPFLFRRQCARYAQKSRIYFIEGTRGGRRLADLTSWIARAEIVQLSFRLVDIRDEAGALIRLRISFCDLGEVQERIIADPLFQEVLHSEAVKGRMPTFLAKQFGAHGSLDSSARTVWRALFLVHVAAWKTRYDRNRGTEAVLFMCRRPWLREVQCYTLQYGVRTVPVNRENLFRLKAFLLGLLRWIPRFVRGYARWLIDLWWYCRSVHSLGAAMSKVMLGHTGLLQGPSPKLAVQYYGHLNLDHPAQFSDLFFWQQSQLPGEDVLVAFGIPRSPLDEAKWSELRRYGMAAVALHPRAVTVPSAPVFFHWPRRRTETPPLQLPKYRGRAQEVRFLLQQISNYYDSYDYWFDFFDRHGVKLYVSWYKYDATHCVIADALQCLGGITTIYQRAFDEFPSPETTLATDVAFGFSRIGVDIEKRSHSVVPYYVITGYLGDHRFPLVREPARTIRDKLRQRGAKHLLAFFDENSTDDSRWHTGHEFMRVNYQFLLEKVLTEPWLGLVLKPKVPSTLRRRLGDVADLLVRAEKTGRCFVFETGALLGSFPPVAAALASDITIHGHLCAGTAGVEAALAGVPTLLMDREGWPASRLYKLGKGRVVFNDWQALWDACRDHWYSPSGMPGLGNWSPMLDELDPFRDGRAAERMGNYLKWLMDGLKSGLPRDAVMADAAERYCSAWGQDKVAEVR